MLLAAATLITAAAVSFRRARSAFVGIIIPHAVRLIWGADHRFLLPLSVLSGAIFMILADLIARTVLSPHGDPRRRRHGPRRRSLLPVPAAAPEESHLLGMRLE